MVFPGELQVGCPSEGNWGFQAVWGCKRWGLGDVGSSGLADAGPSMLKGSAAPQDEGIWGLLGWTLKVSG